MLTRVANIVLAVGATIANALALWALTLPPGGGRYVIDIRVALAALPFAFFGMLVSALISFRVAQWGLALVLRGVKD